VNDDGQPNDTCSPYILPFVQALRRLRYTVTVVIPSTPQSWISKAHLVGKSLKATRLLPSPLPTDRDVEWTVIDGTPASCTQIGLYHLTSNVDLVVSGPNWGRNATTLYNLASGTVGGAMEAAQCGKKAISLSFASKDHQPNEIIEAACRVSAELISHLATNWSKDVEVYAVNVPMISNVDKHDVVYTTSLPCSWTQSSLFQEQSYDREESLDQLIREFKWRPQLKDVERAISQAEPGTDGWALLKGYTR